MKKLTLLMRLAVTSAFMLTLTANAQTIYTYALDEDGLPGTVASGVTASNLERVNGLITEAAACGDGFNSKGFSLSAGPYSTSFTGVELGLTPDPGTAITVTSAEFELRRSNNGNKKARLAYSLDNGASWIDQGVDIDVPFVNCNDATLFTWDFPDFTSSTIVKFRVYGWDASNINGVGSVRNSAVYGTTCTLATFYADADGDTYGDAASTIEACVAPVGYVADNTDCDDTYNTVYPGATEICDGLDNDCNGLIDENLVVATIAPADSAITCKGFPVMFSTEPCAGCTYQWFKNDNPLPGATDYTYSTTKPAYYSVQVNIPGGCFDVSDYSLLISGFNPNANIYYPNGLNLCAPSPGTNILVKVGYTATNTYQWYQDGLPFAGGGATSWKIYPTTAGTYTCSITSIDGCNRVTEPAVVINSCRLANESTSALAVYPNPASNNFTIDMTVEENIETAQIQLVNMMGQIVANATATVNGGILNNTINTADLSSGMYLVKVITETKEYSTQLILNK